MKLNKEVHATALPNVRFERASHSLVGGVRTISNHVLEGVERALQTDVPSLRWVDVEAYANLADSGNGGREGFDARLERGATDKPCGEGVRMLTQNCC